MRFISLCLFSTLFGIQLLSAPFVANEIAISAASEEAVEAGKSIYQKGGNVVDVAVAINLAMAVTNPYFAALGGGGFSLIKMNQKIEALDFREVAPKALNEKTFIEQDRTSSITGGLAVGVPGIPAGLWAMHKKYGNLPWEKLFEPAIHLAQEGFRIHHDYQSRIIRNSKRFNSTGSSLLTPNKKALKIGTSLKQPRLAKLLKLLRKKGAPAFYEGPVAEDIVKAVKEAKGKMELKDLSDYQVRWREVESVNYKDYKISMMPLPSSGSLVIKTALHLMEQWKIDNYEAFGVQELHLFGEIMARAFRSRMLLADPDYFENPTDKLLGEKYLTRLTRSISAFKHIALEPLDEKDYMAKEPTETTHISIADKDGNAVSMTITLNGSFGSGIFTPMYGINLNNEMDDFTTRPGQPNMFGITQGSMNKVEGGKRPLSSMTPSIVEKDGKTRLVLGSPGGPRIISSVLQVLYRVLVTEMDIDAAIQAPRFHHQFVPDKYFYEEHKAFPQSIRELKKKGHNMTAGWAGRVYGVELVNNQLKAAFDQRLPGKASGY